MRKILLWGGLVALAVAIVGGIVGYVVAGGNGLVSAVIGTAMAVVFTGLTAASILVGFRLSGGQMISGAFFGVVLGGWLLKFGLFIALIFVIKDAPWLHPGVAFITLVAAIIGSLAVDVYVVTTSRVPYIDDDPADEETLGRPARR